jgi:hypothetical protein
MSQPDIGGDCHGHCRGAAIHLTLRAAVNLPVVPWFCAAMEGCEIAS